MRHSLHATLYSYAKVNLFLDITGKDEKDGYHFIDSLFQEVTLYDIIDIYQSSRDSVRFINERIPGENTVTAVLRMFKDSFSIHDFFNIEIFKNIPVGAGLGGGSSNAAYVLLTLAKFYSIPKEKILEIGRKVGSDVPFFLYGGLCRVKGKGEIVTPIMAKLKKTYFLIVYPEISISTRWAYSLIKDYGNKDGKIFKNIPVIDIDFLKKIVYNKFQLFVFENCKELAEIKGNLDSFLDSSLSFMSGSGSSLVYVYKEEKKAKRDLERIKQNFTYKVFFCKPYYRRTGER